MPVPAPNLYPPFNIVRLSHVELMVTDLGKSRAFYVDTLGLQVTYEDKSEIHLRALEERGHHCIVLRHASTPCAGHLGFKVFDESDLDRAEAFFKAKDLPIEWIDRPFQSRTLRTCDVQGVPLELYAHMDRLPPIHQKYALYKGVKPLRIDHFNCFSPDVDEAVAFYNEIGFRVTEYTEDEVSHRLWAAWTHRKGGVHDIAFTNGRGPRLHHVAFWVPHPIAIIDLLDLMATTGYLQNSNADRDGTASPTPSFCICAIRMVIALKSIARITRPSIRTLSRSNGISRTPSARPCGARRRRGHGSKKAACSRGLT